MKWKDIIPDGYQPTEEYYEVPILGVTFRQSLAEPAEFVNIHPVLFNKLLKTDAINQVIDIFKSTTAPEELNLVTS